MSLANKLENTYLSILRYVILAIATISLVAVVIAGVMAVTAALSKPPKAPENIKFEDQAKDFKKGFTVEDFKKDDLPKAEETSSQEPAGTPAEKPKDDQFRSLIENSTSKIADNIMAYQRTVHNVDFNKEKLQVFLMNYPSNAGVRRAKPVFAFYFETLLALSGDLAKQAPEIAKLPEEKKVNLDKLLVWHSKQVTKTVESVDKANAQRSAEFQKQQERYIEKKTSTFAYASFAGGAFGTFLIIIMLSILVKIERNLRPLQQIVDSERNQLTKD